jgi:hypothetical protein
VLAVVVALKFSDLNHCRYDPYWQQAQRFAMALESAQLQGFVHWRGQHTHFEYCWFARAGQSGMIESLRSP